MVGDRTSAGWVCCVAFLWVDEAKELERLIYFDRIKDILGCLLPLSAGAGIGKYDINMILVGVKMPYLLESLSVLFYLTVR